MSSVRKSDTLVKFNDRFDLTRLWSSVTARSSR